MSVVGGAVLKFVARATEGGHYSSFVPDDEHQRAYENAEDRAWQLRRYALRKERENPDWIRDFNTTRIREGIKSKVQSME